jgi:hypothetical protein
MKDHEKRKRESAKKNPNFRFVFSPFRAFVIADFDAAVRPAVAAAKLRTVRRELTYAFPPHYRQKQIQPIRNAVEQARAPAADASASSGTHAKGFEFR